jgi:GntR family transcriptional regulator / MocR family aminotransferase
MVAHAARRHAEVHVSLTGREDLSGEIYRQLRRAILDGRMRPGDALPPSRELARQLGISRTTVTVAYDKLWSEGLVSARVGAGTFVSEAVAGASAATNSTTSPGLLRPRALWDAFGLPTALDRPAAFDFRTGVPDVSLFPFAAWRRLISQHLGLQSVTRPYGHPAGDPGLRCAIARHIGITRGIPAAADDVVITSGTQQALDVIARALLAPGDCVAVEDPGYLPARRLFQSLGGRIVGAPVDREGLLVEHLPDEARLVYVTPSHQYPLGMPMSFRRRLALIEWSRRHTAAIIEDDYDSEFRFGGRPVEPLRTLDTDGLVIYVGSFSKTLLPVLRLGFILAPPSLRGALNKAKYVADWHTSTLAQAALAGFIDGGGLARHVRRVKSVYRRRHDLIGHLLVRDFPEHVQLIPSAVGLHMTALARQASTEQIGLVVERAWEAGVAVQQLSSFAGDRPAPAGLVLGYGAIPTDRIEEGLRRLRLCFAE